MAEQRLQNSAGAVDGDAIDAYLLVNGLDCTVHSVLTVIEFHYGPEALLSVEYLVDVELFTYDQMDSRNVPLAKDRIDQALFLAVTPNLPTLKVRLEVDLVRFDLVDQTCEIIRGLIEYHSEGVSLVL